MTTHLEAISMSAPAVFQAIGNGDVSRIVQGYVQQSSTEVFRIIIVTLSTGYLIPHNNTRVANGSAFLRISKFIEASPYFDHKQWCL